MGKINWDPAKQAIGKINVLAFQNRRGIMIAGLSLLTGLIIGSVSKKKVADLGQTVLVNDQEYVIPSGTKFEIKF